MFLILKPFFLFTQLAIIILLIAISYKKNRPKYFLFSSELNFYTLILGAICIGYCFNKNFQIFCIPVYWAKISLLSFSIFLVGNLFLKKIVGDFINQLILGIGIFISIYILIFGSFDYLVWSLISLVLIIPLYYLSRFLNKKFNTSLFDFFNLAGATILFPYLIIMWTIWQVRNKSIYKKIAVGTFPILLFLMGVFLSFRINSIIKNINASENKLATIELLKENTLDEYLTELTLGVHWKYHTRICLFDGWRPPFHNPIIGFAQTALFFGGHFNNKLNIEQSKTLYIKAFPKNKTDFECKCAKNQTIY